MFRNNYLGNGIFIEYICSYFYVVKDFSLKRWNNFRTPPFRDGKFFVPPLFRRIPPSDKLWPFPQRDRSLTKLPGANLMSDIKNTVKYRRCRLRFGLSQLTSFTVFYQFRPIVSMAFIYVWKIIPLEAHAAMQPGCMQMTKAICISCQKVTRFVTFFQKSGNFCVFGENLQNKKFMRCHANLGVVEKGCLRGYTGTQGRTSD